MKAKTIRRPLTWAALVLPLLLAGCVSETPLGKCVGLNGGERLDRRYEYSARNVVLGVVFAEVIAPPVIVALNELKCPVEAITPPARVARPLTWDGR